MINRMDRMDLHHQLRRCNFEGSPVVLYREALTEDAELHMVLGRNQNLQVKQINGQEQILYQFSALGNAVRFFNEALAKEDSSGSP